MRFLMFEGSAQYVADLNASCVVGLTFAGTTMLVLWQKGPPSIRFAATPQKVSLGMASARKVIEF